MNFQFYTKYSVGHLTEENFLICVNIYIVPFIYMYIVIL